MKLIKRLFWWLFGDFWVVRASVWPYEPSWATYNPFRKTIMHTGLPSRNLAQTYCDRMNRED